MALRAPSHPLLGCELLVITACSWRDHHGVIIIANSWRHHGRSPRCECPQSVRGLSSVCGRGWQAKLLQVCQQALASNKGGAKGGAPPAAAAAPRPTITWSEAALGAKGDEGPAKRGGCTLTAAAGRLWLLGGADRAGEAHGDLWEYAPAAGWRRANFDASAPFTPRSGHTTVAAADAVNVAVWLQPASAPSRPPWRPRYVLSSPNRNRPRRCLPSAAAPDLRRAGPPQQQAPRRSPADLAAQIGRRSHNLARAVHRRWRARRAAVDA